jgi:hypothetical protein
MKQKKPFTNGLIERLWSYQTRRLSDRVPPDVLPAVRAMFDCSIRRVYNKTSTDDETFKLRTLPADLPKVNHVVDWIAAGVINGHEWTRKVDAEGRPRKLLKCGTVDALYREAQSWIAKAVQIHRVALDPAEEEILMELADGWLIVRMKTERALDRESSIMQHCVGEGSYDRILMSEASALLSLRDLRNNPHVTVHINVEENALYEVRGKGNAIPKREYRKFMKPFFQRHGFWHADGCCTFYFGLDGEAHAVEDLVPGMRIRHVARLGQADIEALPAGVVLTGATNLKGVDLEAAFGKGFGRVIIDGPTVLSHTYVRVMPARHGFKGDIDMTGSDVVAFEEGFRCHGDLKINSNHKLRRLPELLMVKGDLIIKDTPISALPDHMAIGGNLVIRGTEIRKVPRNVNVGGNVMFSRF